MTKQDIIYLITLLTIAFLVAYYFDKDRLATKEVEIDIIDNYVIERYFK